MRLHLVVSVRHPGQAELLASPSGSRTGAGPRAPRQVMQADAEIFQQPFVAADLAGFLAVMMDSLTQFFPCPLQPMARLIHRMLCNRAARPDSLQVGSRLFGGYRKAA